MSSKNKDVLQFVREDDFVEYYIFPKIDKPINTLEEENIFLNDLLSKVLSIYAEYAQEYIWQKDAFKVTPCNTSTQLLKENETTKGALPIHLFGVTHYGDNIQDEWFIVFLLFKITESIKDVTVRVVDSDGEFLLIEAAEHLPKWATPEICEQRVYIYNGSLHIIPNKPPEENMKVDGNDSDLDSMDEEDIVDNEILDIHDALKEIYLNSDLTRASDPIQDCIKNRISDYPTNISNNFHCSTIYVPIAIAKILDNHHQLIAPAIQAFCSRDMIDMKACRAMKYFPPENRVYCRVKFTKCLYAMLVHNNYMPDRRTGWKLPDVNSKEYKAHNLGIKVACGFEILAAQAKPDNDLENDKAWVSYVQKLTEKGYFRGLLEKSDSHNKLLDEAKQYFLKNRESMKITPMIGKKIVDILKNLDTDMDSSDLIKNISDCPDDDDESWLNISPQKLDEMMKQRFGQNCKVFSTNTDTNPGDLTNKLTEFLDQKSGLDGVDFTEDIDFKFDKPIKPKRGVFKNKNKSAKSKSKSNIDKNKIDFDPDAFACAIQNILDFKIPEENWDQSSESDMSDYNDVQNNSDIDQGEFKSYMNEMDKELASTTIGKSFKSEDVENDNFDEVEDFKPIDIDVNALRNIVKSYEGEMGKSGPASTLLTSIGLRLDPDMQVD